MTEINGLVHAGITVKDLNVSIPFYRDVLGLELVGEEPIKKSRASVLGVPGAVIKIAIMGIPGTSTQIELIQYYNPRSMFDYGAPVNAIGQVHVAFKVANMDKIIAALKEHEVAFTSDNYDHIHGGPMDGMKWIYLKDPDGTNLELIEVGAHD